MSAVVWNPGLALSIGEEDILDYAFDFARWLEGDTIATASATGDRLTATVGSTTDTQVQVRVEAAQSNSSLTLRVNTASGQRADFTTYFNPRPLCGC